MNYVKAGIIGSTGVVTVIFYIAYFSIPNNIKTISNKIYVIGVPLYFGIMNILSVYLKKKLRMSYIKHVLLISIISTIFVFSLAYSSKTYRIEGAKWLQYLLILFILHFVAYNILESINLFFNV